MKYKFVDIGCSFWSVSTDIFGTKVKGILVEPIKEFLDVLPSSNSIIKENVAISDKTETRYFTAVFPKDINIKYYDTKTLEILKQKWIKWKAKNNDKEDILYHPVLGQIIASGGSTFHTPPSLSTPNFVKKIVKVKTITLNNLFERNNVSEIDHIKIDTEGHENIILNQLLTLLINKKVKINKEIRFECNEKSNNNEELKNIAYDICSKFDFKYSESFDVWDKDIILKK